MLPEFWSPGHQKYELGGRSGRQGWGSDLKVQTGSSYFPPPFGPVSTSLSSFLATTWTPVSTGPVFAMHIEYTVSQAENRSPSRRVRSAEAESLAL